MKVCGLVRSTWGTSLGEDKLGARCRILNTKVACRARAGQTFHHCGVGGGGTIHLPTGQYPWDSHQLWRDGNRGGDRRAISIIRALVELVGRESHLGDTVQSTSTGKSSDSWSSDSGSEDSLFGLPSAKVRPGGQVRGEKNFLCFSNIFEFSTKF